MTLFENERIDEVNDALSLIQKTDGLTFGTDALLLAAYSRRGFGAAAELGSGSGIISMLMLSREKCRSVSAFEVQRDYAELTERNAALNSLSDRLCAICLDVRDIPDSHREKYDLVFTNPPYMKSTSGLENRVSAKNIARHEVLGNIDDFAAAAARILKFGGSFLAVYRPDRTADLIVALRSAGLEPKRLTFVHANPEARPSMLLIEAKRGGHSGMIVTAPLFIYRDGDNREYSEDMLYIDKTGDFPKKFFQSRQE